MENQPARGGLVSRFDYRDQVASAAMSTTLAAVTLPATFHTDLGPVLMQAKEPACVSHSVVELLRLHFLQKTGKSIDFSPRFLDTLVKRYDGQDRATSGTYPRMVLKLAVQYGCATETTLPNDTSLPVLQYRDDSLLTPAVFADAAQYKIPGYFAVPLDLQSTRASILLYGAISTLFHIDSAWWTPSWNDSDIDPLRIPTTILDGHQITPNGWINPTLNTLRNHWSNLWANNGEANYDQRSWTPYTLEQWGVAEIPADVADFLKTLPSPADFHYQWNTNLAYGQQNDDIKFAQIALMILGLLGPVDPGELGIYGPKTAGAVGAYQKAHQITPVPHSIGPLTRAVLNSQFLI